MPWKFNPFTGKLDRVASQREIFGVGVNDIGIPGGAGFGVGICPAVPTGFTPMPGFDEVLSDNYGNYQYTDGSVMVWVPAFFYKIGNGSNGLQVNFVDVKPYSAYATVALANADGYALHRAFYDGSDTTPQLGFFVDKYLASNNAGVASSLRNGIPLSSAVRGSIANTAFATLNAVGGVTPTNTYGGAFLAAKTRGSRFHITTRFIHAALALLSMAHGQAATGPTLCAWYSSGLTTNFPKGCNNNAYSDTNDTSITYVPDGSGQNCGKTGSAVPFARTTHNGQGCGVADLNGCVWEINSGVTCMTTSANISGATQANPCVITTSAAHGLQTGALVQIASVGGMTQLNDKIVQITRIDDTSFSLDNCNSSAFGAYTSGGSITAGTWYALNPAASARNLTGGNTLATDQFGATGVAAHSTAFTPSFRTDYAQNGWDKRFGRGANQVLSEATSGAGWLLAGMGMPASGTGISDGTTGSNLFGADYLYQYVRNELCLLSGGRWDATSGAGVWAVYWGDGRTGGILYVGFRSASYL